MSQRLPMLRTKVWKPGVIVSVIQIEAEVVVVVKVVTEAVVHNEVVVVVENVTRWCPLKSSNGFTFSL